MSAAGIKRVQSPAIVGADSDAPAPALPPPPKSPAAVPCRQRLLIRLGPRGLAGGPLHGPSAAPGVWEAVVRFDRMRTALLLQGLRTVEPVGSAAHAILIYRLSAASLGRLLSRDDLPPRLPSSAARVGARRKGL
jgi:hypothetical protein